MKPFPSEAPERLLKHILAPTLVALGLALFLGTIIISRIDKAYTQVRGDVINPNETLRKIRDWAGFDGTGRDGY